MQWHKYRWNPALGFAALFVLYVLAAVALGSAYQMWMERIHNLAGRLAGPVLFGCLLAGAAFGIKRAFKITWDIAAFLVTLAGSLGVYYLFWDGWPLRGDTGPVAFMDWELTGNAILILWALEAAVIALPPLYVAFRRAGVFLRRYNRWADLRLLEYGFVPFTDHELDRLALGETEAILRKPIDLTGLSRIHAIAFCYVDKELTEYIAVFKAGWDRQGGMERGALLLLTALTTEKIEALQGELYEIHREEMDGE
jgi:hypothetical protein